MEDAMSNWTTANIPSQSGKFAVITGANSGIGYDTAVELARAGADVVLAGRSELKGKEAVQRILRQVPKANVRFSEVDLASLASIATFAERMLADGRPIDLLVNNAGVMAFPTRQATADGFEAQFGTNHLGHSALTGRLLPLLRKATHPRVVNVASLAHRRGTIDFDDLQSAKKYVPWNVYSQSKLANLLFTLELQRRSDANGWGILAVAAHPGWARTELISNGPGAKGAVAIVSGLFAPFFSQSAAGGALPTLFAATAAEVTAAGYYGPSGFMELKGNPGPAFASAAAKDSAVAGRLWEVSEQLTGVHFE